MKLFENLPKLGEPLEQEHVDFMTTFTKSCRHSILQMVVNAQSGHPGGSMSSIDYLATLYCFLISQNGNRVVVSNGHVSPCVYSTLAELDYIPKQEVVETFRKIGSIYEGHITRHIPGIDYGTGPLGIGVSVAASYALSEKMKDGNNKVFGLLGDGEAQEGQVHEMIHFARQHELNNLILFVDYNKVQLTDSLEEIQKIDIHRIFEAGHWKVIEIDGHNYTEIWSAISEAHNSDKPVVIVGNTIMGHGGGFMEEPGINHKPDWHGKSPKPEEAAPVLEMLNPTEEELALIEEFRTHIKWKPQHNEYPEKLSKIEGINTGTPIVHKVDTPVDCRSGYGKALLDLAKNNKKVIALTADLRGSVKTDGVFNELPDQYIECGIAEQNMVSMGGGFSLDGWVPFASTFGAFMSSRAKDQARVNDINYTNLKMVATHCGLSVGEDGPTHQAIDDMGSFLGFFNTNVIEPADANQCDRIIRYIASHYGNFYVRMGRHKFPVLTKEDGTPFYDENYEYRYGRCDVIRTGSDITIAASGACVTEALQAREELEGKISVEVIAISSIKQFDKSLHESIIKTKKVITVEDHNTRSGLGASLARKILMEGLQVDKFKMLGVEEYQLSGKADELYESGGISANHIAKTCQEFV